MIVGIQINLNAVAVLSLYGKARADVLLCPVERRDFRRDVERIPLSLGIGIASPVAVTRLKVDRAVAVIRSFRRKFTVKEIRSRNRNGARRTERSASVGIAYVNRGGTESLERYDASSDGCNRFVAARPSNRSRINVP